MTRRAKPMAVPRGQVEADPVWFARLLWPAAFFATVLVQWIWGPA